MSDAARKGYESFAASHDHAGVWKQLPPGVVKAWESAAHAAAMGGAGREAHAAHWTSLGLTLQATQKDWSKLDPPTVAAWESAARAMHA